MTNRWLRWRQYMDQVEDVARVCGHQLADVERVLRTELELEAWPATQRESVDAELIRRLRDVPFMRELIDAAWRVGSERDLEPPDAVCRPWTPEEERLELPSSDRPSSRRPLEPLARATGAAPARLRAAERALASRTRSVALVLDRLTNPRNASAVVRTADAFGLQEVHFVQPEGRVKVMRSLTRSAERFVDLFWYRQSATAISTLRERGYRVLAADYGPDALPLDEIPLGDRVAVVLGSEQLGISPGLRAEVDALFYIPTSGFASYLNVSVAAAIVLYEIDRRMREQGLRRPLEEQDRARLRRAWYVALAGDNDDLAREYLTWLDDPPRPAPLLKRVPSREKSRSAENSIRKE